MDDIEQCNECGCYYAPQPDATEDTDLLCPDCSEKGN